MNLIKGKAISELVPGFKKISMWRISALSPAALPYRKYPSYSFLVTTLSNTLPYCSRKDYVNEKLQWHNRELKPRSSHLYSSVSTNCITAYSYLPNILEYFLILQGQSCMNILQKFATTRARACVKMCYTANIYEFSAALGVNLC